MPRKIVWTAGQDTQIRQLRTEGATWDGSLKRSVWPRRGDPGARILGAEHPPATATAAFGEADRASLPSGHARTWDPIVRGTSLEGVRFQSPAPFADRTERPPGGTAPGSSTTYPAHPRRVKDISSWLYRAQPSRRRLPPPHGRFVRSWRMVTRSTRTSWCTGWRRLGRRCSPCLAPATPRACGARPWTSCGPPLSSYGWTEVRIRPAVPSAGKITRMDEAMSWIPLIPVDRFVLRRVVGARSLVHPITDRHLFPWRRLGKALGADHKAVQRWHTQGIEMIVAALKAA